MSGSSWWSKKRIRSLKPDKAMDEKNTTIGACEIAQIMFQNSKKRVEELLNEVVEWDVKLKNCGNRIASLEDDLAGKETAL